MVWANAEPLPRVVSVRSTTTNHVLFITRSFQEQDDLLSRVENTTACSRELLMIRLARFS
jgi:hypothetical protein